MRTARIIRIVLSVFIYFLSLSMSITSILAGYSAISILTNPGSINVPSGPIQSNMDLYRYSKYGEENFYSNVPFNFTNSGYFTLTNLKLEIEFTLNYLDLDTNQETSITIFSSFKSYPDVERRETYSGWFNISKEDFYYDKIPSDIFFSISVEREPLVDVTANIYMNASYGLELYAFSVQVYDLKILETEPEDLPAGALNELLSKTGQVI